MTSLGRRVLEAPDAQAHHRIRTCQSRCHRLSVAQIKLPHLLGRRLRDEVLPIDEHQAFRFHGPTRRVGRRPRARVGPPAQK
jgi:hypothetical protein